MKESLNEQEKLQVIYETIDNAKSNVKDNGFFYLLWGWLVLTASLLQFILLNYTSFEYHYLGWPVLMTLGAIASVIYGIRLGNRAAIRTHLDNIIIGLWWAFFVLLLTIIILTVAGPFNFGITSPLIILLFSFATFVSGVILRYNPLKLGGTLSWAVGIIAFLVTMEYQLLMTALAIIIAYLIPGYMLKYRK